MNEKQKVPLEYQNNMKPVFRINLGSLSPKYASKTVTINEKGKIFSPSFENVGGEMEKEIIESRNPLPLDENVKINVNGYTGVWSNRLESVNWKGPIPLENYRINNDPDPYVIKKKPESKLTFNQDVKVKYLNPPRLPKPGDIVINAEPDRQIQPGPPIIIRQNRERIPDPPPMVIREAPPRIPQPINQKVINIPGKVVPPPARKVIIEKLPQIPPKPRSIIIERWLPFEKQTRNVIYNKPKNSAILSDPKNLIIDWESPDVEVVHRIKNEGIFNTDPTKYSSKFKDEILTKLPDFTDKIARPRGIILAAEKQDDYLPELVGDVDALMLIDLEKAGLAEYKEYLENKLQNSSKNKSIDETAFKLFKSIETAKSGLVRIDDVLKVLYGLNMCFGKKYTQSELKNYLNSLDIDFDDHLNFKQFSNAYLECVN